MSATPIMQPASPQPPFAMRNPTRGCWETSQADLFGRAEPYSAIWSTSGELPDGSPTCVVGRRTASPVPRLHHRLP